MNSRFRIIRLGGLALAGWAAAAVVGAQSASSPVNGTVMDATGSVMVRRGARSFPAARGTSLQAGDQIFILDASSLTFACAGQDAVKVTVVGTFTYSGCQPQALAAIPPPTAAGQTGATQAAAGAPAPGVASPGATAAAAGAPPPPEPVVAAVPRKGGGGATLGIIGGLALLAAAAGGGGGGGGGSSSP